MYHCGVLVAQALAEYGALGAVVDSFTFGYQQLVSWFGGLGANGLLALAAIALLWLLIGRFR